MRGKKIVPLLILFSFFLNGCVYLRLLEVKKQVARFDQYFKVEKEDGLTVTFLKPVIYEKDMKWMGFHPSQELDQEDQVVWLHILEKLYFEGQVEDENFDIYFESKYNNSKLKEIYISERYFTFFPKELFITLFKSLGGAKIDKKNKKASSKVESFGAERIDFPTYSDVLKVLGKPFKIVEVSGQKTLSYNYRLKLADDTEEFVKNSKREYSVVLTFSKENKLINISGDIPLLGSTAFSIEHPESTSTQSDTP